VTFCSYYLQYLILSKKYSRASVSGQQSKTRGNRLLFVHHAVIVDWVGYTFQWMSNRKVHSHLQLIYAAVGVKQAVFQKYRKAIIHVMFHSLWTNNNPIPAGIKHFFCIVVFSLAYLVALNDRNNKCPGDWLYWTTLGEMFVCSCWLGKLIWAWYMRGAFPQSGP